MLCFIQIKKTLSMGFEIVLPNLLFLGSIIMIIISIVFHMSYLLNRLFPFWLLGLIYFIMMPVWPPRHMQVAMTAHLPMRR